MKDRLAQPGRLRAKWALALLIVAVITMTLLALIWLRGAPEPGRMVELPLELPSAGASAA